MFIKENWKYLLGLALTIIVISIGYYEYKAHQSIPMATVQSVNYAEIAKALAEIKPGTSAGETKYITEKIIEVKQSPPQIVYVTATQSDADKKAQGLAKADKGDIVIKETTSPVTNSFYSVHTEKSKKIKAGFTVLNKEVYADLGYQQGKNEVIAHYAPVSKDYGSTYMRTLFEW